MRLPTGGQLYARRTPADAQVLFRFAAWAEAVSDYEAEFGEITEEEMDEQQRRDLDAAADVRSRVALCDHDDEILTSDPVDISSLAQAARVRVSVIPV